MSIRNEKARDVTSRYSTLLIFCLLEALINPILKWLLQYQISPQYVPNATEGTCTWIEQHEGYKSWVEAGYNRPLCLFGPLGSFLCSVTLTPITDLIL